MINSVGYVVSDGCTLDVVIIMMASQVMQIIWCNSTINGACWSHLKHLKHTQTETNLEIQSIFYIKQYCEVCFVWSVHTVYLAYVEYCEITTFIPERVIPAHSMYDLNSIYLFKIHEIPLASHKINRLLNFFNKPKKIDFYVVETTCQTLVLTISSHKSIKGGFKCYCCWTFEFF